MIRSIAGFRCDDEGDWVAELSCLHSQHVRHRPPFQLRPWVVVATSREARIGADLDCPLCERAEMPEGLVRLELVGAWDETTLPLGLQRSHLSAAGPWERICVLAGRAVIRFDDAGETFGPQVQLDAGGCQLIPPEVWYRLIVAAPARLELERWGRPDAAERTADVVGP